MLIITVRYSDDSYFNKGILYGDTSDKPDGYQPMLSAYTFIDWESMAPVEPLVPFVEAHKIWASCTLIDMTSPCCVDNPHPCGSGELCLG